MKTMSYDEFREVYTKKLLKVKYRTEPLKFDGYRRIYETGDVYEYIVELKEGAKPNWHGLYEAKDFVCTAKLNGRIIKMK